MRLTHRQRAALSVSIFGLLSLGLILFLWLGPVRDYFHSPEELRDTIKGYGPAAPLVIIGFQILQVILAPIPGQALDIANGYLFGWWGIAISMIGLSIGSVLAIALAKRYGRPLVEVLITPKGMESIKPYTGRRNQWLFFILFLLPGTPDDILCFAIGLSQIPFWRCVVIVILGRFPGVAAAVIFGLTGRGLNPLEFTAIAIVVSLIIGAVIWRIPLGNKTVGEVINPPKTTGS